ncbi:MAG: hypothetical protein L0229_14805 [Blastocatellia bacterium]|nr:hypothetical protein [Blastocatellia bacterium]
MKFRDYSPPIYFVLVISVLCFFLLYDKLLSGFARGIIFAFVCGALVGISEIASRYRDEPFYAILSPYGLVYTLLNGTISLLAFFLIDYYKDSFPTVSGNNFVKALAAGFGASAVMRTRLAVLKGEGDKEISVGPDYVITVLLQMFDERIDRARAKRRQAIVVENLPKIRGMGSFATASNYLLASLLAFQNMDEAEKNQLSTIINDYGSKPLPDDIKFLALGFVFLTLVGEAQFADVLDNAAKIKTQAPPPGE